MVVVCVCVYVAGIYLHIAVQIFVLGNVLSQNCKSCVLDSPIPDVKIYIYIHTQMYTSVYMCIYILMYVYMFIFIYVYIFERQQERKLPSPSLLHKYLQWPGLT